MAKFVEIYTSAEETKEQTEYREAFGWKHSINLTERGVFEVTYTRDDSTAKNKKLKTLEDDFNQCFSAEEYIERYNDFTVSKKKFKAFHPFILLLVLYISFSMLLQGVLLLAFSYLYKSDPSFISNMPVVIGEQEYVLDENFALDLNLKEIGIYDIVTVFGVKNEILTVTASLLFDLFFYVGAGSLAIAIIVIFWAINKKRVSNLYYKAEVKYVQKRKDMLNSKIDDLDKRVDAIIDKTAEVHA